MVIESDSDSDIDFVNVIASDTLTESANDLVTDSVVASVMVIESDRDCVSCLVNVIASDTSTESDRT